MSNSVGFGECMLTASAAMASALEELGTASPDADVIASWVSAVRFVERQSVGLLSGLSQLAWANAAAGVGPPLEEVLRDGNSVSDAAARRDVERRRVAALFPLVGVAIEAGSAVPENVDVLARITSKMTDAETAELVGSDERLAVAVGKLSTDSFRKRLQRNRDRIRGDHGQTEAEQASALTRARVSVSRDKGTYRLDAVFDPIQGTAVQSAFWLEYQRLCDELGAGHGLTQDRIMAQTLHDLIVRGASVTPDELNNRPVVLVQVLTDVQTLSSGPHSQTISETADGVPVCASKLGQLTCDCVIQRIESLPDGKVNVSRTSRTATQKQRAALRALYDCCPISGEAWSRLEIHHVEFVSQGGETQLCNLLPISRRWHHLIHDAGWRLEMDLDRTLRLYRPDGTLHRTIAPPVPVLHRTADSDSHALAA